LAIVLSVLQYTDFDYPFGIFKHFLLHKNKNVDIKFSVHATRFWNNLNPVRSKPKDLKGK